MKPTKTPAPRRAGNEKKAALEHLRKSLELIAHDREALEIVDRLVTGLAARSPR